MKRPFPSVEFSKFVISRWFSKILRFQTTKTTTRNTNRLVTIQITSYVSYDIAILVALMPCFLLSNVCVCVRVQTTHHLLTVAAVEHSSLPLAEAVYRLCLRRPRWKSEIPPKWSETVVIFLEGIKLQKKKWIHLTGGKLRFYFVWRDDFKYSV